jgi:hypothetical protein
VRSYSDLTHAPSVWPEVSAWANEAETHVTVLPRDERGATELAHLQMPTSTFLGAVVLESAGILVDHCWLRILGSGANHLPSSLAHWNGLLPGTSPVVPGALLVAWDVLGGLFALNDTALPGAKGSLHYFGPHTLEWLDTGMAYGGFLRWAFAGSIGQFSEGLRWAGWEEEVSRCRADHGLLAYPFPWSGRRTSSAVPSHWSTNEIRLGPGRDLI